MKPASILCVVAMSLCLTPAAFAQRTLDSAQTQGILNTLTSQPRNTWIPAGTIQATHRTYGAAKVADETVIGTEISRAIQEYTESTNKRELTAEAQKMMLDAIPFNVRYRLANEYAMTSHEVVKYDGERFYWEIDVSSRSDSVRPDAALAANTMTDEFDMTWNQQRIFAWDGQKYTTYSASGGRAMVDAAGNLPRAVNGPLTAGLIPWGHGKFSSASLSSATVTASETTSAGAAAVQMTIAYADGSLTELTLDPSKDYAVTAATFHAAGDFVATYTCSGYRPIASRWVPSSVSIERQTGNLKSKAPTTEVWTDIEVTSTSAPSPSSFNVPLGLDAMIEYVSPIMASSTSYVNSYEVDTDDLLAQRLAYGAAEGLRQQNCATAALQCVASQFQKSVSGAAMAKLVGPNGRTSLSDLKQCAQGLGLYGRIVKTDLAGLKNLAAAKAILHIPGKNHFLVVDRVDDQYVWVIDLSKRTFYYRQSVHFFPLEWSGGIALLLSDRPISGQFPPLPDTAIEGIEGGEYYQCNTIIQEYGWKMCETETGLCLSTFVLYHERWGCGVTESGTCTLEAMIRKQTSPCMPDPIIDCTVTGEWFYYMMYACY